MRAVVAIVALAGCVRSDLVTCGEIACPIGTVCAAVTDPQQQQLCVQPAQLTACTGLHDHQACQTEAIVSGRCYQGVCLPVACGNGRVDIADPADPADIGEVCDDGNPVGGDGCSADCTSTESCGNGLVDLVTGERCDDGNHLDHDGCDSRCQSEALQWSSNSFADAQNRTQLGMAYDAAHRQLVMFGGVATATGAVLGDTRLWDGIGWREATPPLSPRPRKRHAMAYDTVRHRVVLFGGISADGDTLADTWEWDGSRWIPIAPAVQPPPRSDHVMTYDGARHRVIMFGGSMPSGPAPRYIPDWADTWAWDGTSWTQLATTHRPTSASSATPQDGRSNMAMAFDPTRGVDVLVGGTSTYQVGPFLTVYQADDHVWELDATDWHEVIPTSGPAARSNATMTYDPAMRRVMLLGGSSGATTFNDAWEWTDQTWTPIVGGTAPAGRTFAGAAADLDRAVVVLFGGTSVADPPLWEWNGTLWNAPTTSQPTLGSIPFYSAAVTTDTRRNREILVEPGGNTWERGDGGWAHLATFPGSASHAISLAYDPVHDVTVLFRWSTTNAAETWLWNGTVWTQASPPTSPPARDGASFALDQAGHLVLFGGTLAVNTALDDTWIWDGTTWTQAMPCTIHPRASSR